MRAEYFGMTATPAIDDYSILAFDGRCMIFNTRHSPRAPHARLARRSAAAFIAAILALSAKCRDIIPFAAARKKCDILARDAGAYDDDILTLFSPTCWFSRCC